jgi:hypothetical protein
MFLRDFKLIQPQGRHFGFWAVSSAEPDNIFWKKFEEKLFSLLK